MVSDVEQGMQALHRGNYDEAAALLGSAEGDEFTRALGLQACSLLAYITEKEGLPAVNKSLAMGRAAVQLNPDHFDAHLMLGQAFAARYQRRGNDNDQRRAARHYSQAGRFVSQRPDYERDVLQSRIYSLQEGLRNCHVGIKEVEFTTRQEICGLHDEFPDASFYDTSTNAPTAGDYRFVINASEFSPFIPYGDIPVPGTQLKSDSVEGVWQGLKIIGRRIDKSYFRGKGRKREGKPQGHQLGKEVLDYVNARKQIFVPTYRHMINHCVDQESVHLILERAKRGRRQFFFDVDKVGDIEDTSEPLAHSSVLVNIINETLGIKPLASVH